MGNIYSFNRTIKTESFECWTKTIYNQHVMELNKILQDYPAYWNYVWEYVYEINQRKCANNSALPLWPNVISHENNKKITSYSQGSLYIYYQVNQKSQLDHPTSFQDINMCSDLGTLFQQSNKKRKLLSLQLERGAWIQKSTNATVAFLGLIYLILRHCCIMSLLHNWDYDIRLFCRLLSFENG